MGIGLIVREQRKISEEYGCKHIPNASHTGTKSSINIAT